MRFLPNSTKDHKFYLMIYLMNFFISFTALIFVDLDKITSGICIFVMPFSFIGCIVIIFFGRMKGNKKSTEKILEENKIEKK